MKTCLTPGCDNIIEWRTDFCASCNSRKRKIAKQRVNDALKREALLSKSKPWYPKPKKVSAKRKEENEAYIILREKFLLVNPECQAGIENICTKESEDIHHMKGRGILLNETKFWLAVCRNCHIYITNHPVDAMKRNLSFSRLATIKPTI